MKTHYCVLCGSQSYYEITRPSFCQECSAPQNIEAAKNARKTVAAPTRRPIAPIQDEYEDEFVEEIDVDIEKIARIMTKGVAAPASALDKGTGVKLKSVANTPDEVTESDRGYFSEADFKKWKSEKDKHTEINLGGNED